MKSKLQFLSLVVLLMLVFSGCATTLTREQMALKTQNYVLPQQPKEQSGLVYVVRPDNVGRLVRFNVFVDDANKDDMEAGFTRGGQYIYFNIAPGTHKLYSVAENTAEGTLDVEAGKAYYIQQIPSMGFLFARNQMKRLDDVEGKYLLQKCHDNIGEIKRSNFP